ncbi:MAG TPA: NAD(P)/FAD-dependent oxidoreductase, partial [Thermomicrobiales bacterium]|nr:NAD(P)/FAD-dependent oxidoreductase [Thermomicrobiales bacterium]
MASVVHAPEQYDAIIIGAGHNGLITACYLAQAGVKVLLLERYHEVGGAAISEQTPEGFTLSTGSYVLSLVPRQIFDELGVWSELELLERNPRFFAPFPDGTSLTMWNDHARWLDNIRRISPHDADAYDRYDNAVEIACAVMDKYILGRPPSWDQVASNFRTPEEQKIFQMFYLGAVADIAEYYFDSDQMQATVSSSGLIGTFRGPRDPGTGYVKLYHSMGMSTGHRGRWAYVRGAMGAITQALRKVAVRSGVTIRTNTDVAQITVHNGRATGVELSDGQTINANLVISNADPKRTYLNLVDESDIPADYRRAIQAIKIESPVIKINMAVRELPKFLALPDDQQLQGSTGGLFIAPSIDYLQTAYYEAKLGNPATHPFMNIHMQSAIDRSIVPNGEGHTISIFTQYF